MTSDCKQWIVSLESAKLERLKAVSLLQASQYTFKWHWGNCLKVNMKVLLESVYDK